MFSPSGTRARFSAAARLCVAVCGIVSLCSVSARADHAQVRLRYDRAVGAERCLDETALRDAVAARLGYDPFVTSELADMVDVEVTPRGQGFEGRIVRRTRTETTPSKPSRIRSRGSDCGELGDALALAVAVAVDPLSLTRGNPPDVASNAQLEVEPSAQADARAVPDQPAPDVDDGEEALPPDLDARARLAGAEPRVTHLRAGAGATLGGWVLPRVSLGGQLLVGVSHAWFELDVDARYEASAAHRMSAGTLDASLVTASLLPCARYGWVLSCVSGTVGSMRGTLRDVGRADDSALYAALGVRSALEIPLWDVLSLRLHGAWLYRLVDTELLGFQPRLSGFAGGALLMVRTP